MASACGGEVRISADDQALLADGTRLADSLSAAPRWDDAGVVALGYLERLRLGLGSPFRLAEQAAADSRLPGALGRRTAWALLAATYRSQAFAVDSAALGSDPRTLLPGAVADGGWHRALIDSAVASARTARTGEEAVRIAYALARAEGLVPARVASAAVHAAALARDRRLAADDMRQLLNGARSSRNTESAVDALSLAREWRSTHRFLSEAPLLSDALTPDAAQAVALAEGLLGQMRHEGEVAMWRSPAGAVAAVLPSGSASAPADSNRARVADDSAGAAISVAGSSPVRPAAGSIGATPAARRDDPTLGALTAPAAQRLAALPSAQAAFPSAPVIVTLGGFRHTLAADTLPGIDSTAELRRARARLVARARTEELLAAEWASLRGTLPLGGPARRELAALVQAAAVAVRPWAQAPAVGVAVGSPTSRPGAEAEVDAVRARDGFRSIEFQAGTAPAWRAASARQLGDAVADLRSVFTDLTLDGLRVRVGESPRRDLALALHEPATRTVYLPPTTGAGTVAHELVHDLDWQAAHARVPVGRTLATTDALPRSGYRSDHLARAGTGALAQAVRGLGGTRLGAQQPVGAAAPGAAPIDADRPAERLARAADFYVAAVLARDGRANGVLSAVQDRVLTGYAGVVAPEPGDGAAQALVDVLDALPGVGAGTTSAGRMWYLARFGSAGVRSPLAVAGLALDALPSWDGERVLRFAGVPGGLSDVDAVVFTGSCGVGGGIPASWQPRLLWLAADARARGLIRGRAAHAAAAGGPFWGWNARATLGGPWQPEPAAASVARVRDALLRAALGTARRAAGLCALAPATTR